MARSVPEGWTLRPSTGFSAMVGPFWVREEEGNLACGFVPGSGHLNEGGTVHGGMLATAFDVALGMVVWEAVGRRPIATIQLNVAYVAAVRSGDFVEARSTVVRVTRSLAFMRGALTVAGHTVATADGIWKVVRPA